MTNNQRQIIQSPELDYYNSEAEKWRPVINETLQEYVPRAIKKYGTERLEDDIMNSSEFMNYLTNEYLSSRNIQRNGKAEFIGGKKLRPIEHIKYFLGTGGDLKDGAVYTASKSELVHLASLTHDDIIDLDEMRYSTDTVRARFKKIYLEKKKSQHPYQISQKQISIWEKEAEHWGNSKAILMGDVLLGLSEDIIDESKFSPNKIAKMKKLRNDLYIGLVLGVSRELDTSLSGLEGIKDPTYKTIVKYKSNIHKEALQSAGIATDQSEKQMKIVGDFADATTEEFQMGDDLMLFRESEKDAWTDIRDGRPSIVNLETLRILKERNKHSELEKFRKIIYGHKATKEQCQDIIEIMRDNLKIPEIVIERMYKSRETALSKLSDLKTDEDFQRFGIGLVDYLMVREK